MTSFDDVRLPEDVETGAEGGPLFNTNVLTQSNGSEQRAQNWLFARHTYKISYGVSETDYQAVRAFFYNRRGKSRGFRFKDWSDYAVAGQVIVPAGQAAVLPLHLTKSYLDTGNNVYTRRITRVVAGTLRIYDTNGTAIAGWQESFGQLTWPNGLPAYTGGIFADFEFDVPVRFDVDQLDLTMETAIALEVNTIPLIELLEDSIKLNGG